MRQSLFLRILLPLSLAMSVCWILLVLILGHASYRELYEVLDQQMIQTAQMLTVPMDYSKLPELRYSGKSEDQEYQIHFVVWNEGKDVLFADKRGSVLPSSFESNGFYRVENASEEYRVYTYHNLTSRISASAGYPTSVKKKIVEEVIEKFWLPWLLGLALMGAVALLSLWWGLGPLRKLQKELKTRDPRHLQKFSTEVPFEVQNLKNELNRLIDQIRLQMEKERRFTADAAHELKTPLAAIRVQTEILAMDLDSEEQKKQAEKIMQGVDRTNRLIEQLLTLSRLDEKEVHAKKSALDLANLWNRQKESLKNLIEEKAAHVSLQQQGAFSLEGEEVLLEVLFKNLIENSLKYGPQGVHIELVISPQEFSVTDNGPGVAAEKMERVKERFFRPEGQVAPGSGLGLSIVEKIAELHGLEMTLSPQSPQGLKVSFRKS